MLSTETTPAQADREDEVFVDCGASPVLEPRRSTRTSARKRSSIGVVTAPKPKPKRDRKMSVSRIPVGQKATPTSAASANKHSTENPFSGLVGGAERSPGALLLLLIPCWFRCRPCCLEWKVG